MAVYVVLVVLLLIYSIIYSLLPENKYFKILYLFFSFFTLALVLGLRDFSVGEDTLMYCNIFDYAQEVEWKDILTNLFGRTTYNINQFGYKEDMESLYLGFCKIVGIFTNSKQIFLFTVSSAICFLYAKFIYDNSSNIVLSMWVFTLESFYMISFNMIRQLFAIGIALQAFKYLQSKNICKILIIYLFAFFIHNSSIICLLTIPLMYLDKLNKEKIFKTMILCVALLPIFIKFGASIIVQIIPRYETYFTTNFWDNNLGFSSILWFFELFFIFVIYKNNFKNQNAFLIVIFTLIYLSLELTGLQITMFSRVAYFYRSFLILLIPLALSYINSKDRLIITFITYAVLFLIFVAYCMNPARNYHFFW